MPKPKWFTKEIHRFRNYVTGKKWIEIKYKLFGLPVYVRRIDWF
ncbi:hypothetical protein BSNK01_16370 [Bacillaceae bacterium]